MSQRDLYHTEAAERETAALAHALKNTAPKPAPAPVLASAVPPPPVKEPLDPRVALRVLIISQDTPSLLQDTPSLDGTIPLEDLFAEIHILILRQGRRVKEPVERVSDSVWRYIATAPFWWLTPRAGREMVEAQLVFAAGFRPDLIIARDPFESAVLAAHIAAQYERPAQLHVLEDYSVAEYAKKHHHNSWRKLLPKKTLSAFPSVRAATGNIERMLRKQRTIPDLAMLPRFQNYEALQKAPVTDILQQTYAPLTFFILYIGKLDHESTMYRAIDAARFVLRTPRVGMVVLGDGPAKSEFQKRAKILGVDKQTIFETRPVNTDAYLKSANMVVVTDTNDDADEVILKAAAAGVPIVMSRTERREDLFEDGVSAYLCDAVDIQLFAKRINELLSNTGLRRIFVQNAQAMIDERFHQDTAAYVSATKASIEAALTVESDPEYEIKETSQ